jgi:hypothetical protein
MFQPVDSLGNGTLYKNSIDCFMKTLKNENVFSLWKGKTIVNIKDLLQISLEMVLILYIYYYKFKIIAFMTMEQVLKFTNNIF